MFNEKLTVEGLGFARTWLNASVAAGQDESRPGLYRATTIELFEDGLQVVASDAVLLVGGWVPLDYLAPRPGFDELPGKTIVVADYDKRGHALMRHIESQALEAQKNEEPFTVDLSIVEMESDSEPTLTQEMSRKGLRISIPTEELTLNIVELPAMSWRSFMALTPGNPSKLTLSTDVFKALGKLRSLNGFPLTLKFAENNGPAVIEFGESDETYMFGAVQPMSVREEQEV